MSTKTLAETILMLYVVKDKKWGATHSKTHNFRPRKEAIVHFRLITGQDYLGEHLNKIGILYTNISPIYKSGIMNSEHLLDRTGKDRVAQEQGDHLRPH
ncbi:hypothetical protein NPIL_321321 [Nephila pilipes]|uniref:Uncharacterized protein n=1 Tax=Nephila pilipes TaxID=299642 RepID=A0A8X6QYY4_NEPPI|nr:hypothetical protein NPIL_321321 [Nephila pilipes]